eukprot:3356504-Rhodomonas_salina.1
MQVRPRPPCSFRAKTMARKQLCALFLSHVLLLGAGVDPNSLVAVKWVGERQTKVVRDKKVEETSRRANKRRRRECVERGCIRMKLQPQTRVQGCGRQQAFQSAGQLIKSTALRAANATGVSHTAQM